MTRSSWRVESESSGIAGGVAPLKEKRLKLQAEINRLHLRAWQLILFRDGKICR